mmetsp:Transcript_7697/g.18781  ORF Transcript_7697/g.18781 Transcript_7697/m.18781 type:complete len:395 (-) Transcript_7697:138-1322(-)
MSSSDPPWFLELTDLASESLGSKVVFATDEWFAAADNLLKPTEPVFITDKFTTYGKWMDGWESRRKRTAGHDWCVVQLGMPGTIRGVLVDTRFFTGNQAPRFSLQAAELKDSDADVKALLRSRTDRGIGTKATDGLMEMASRLRSENWVELVRFTPLRPGYEGKSVHYFEISPELSSRRWTHVRVNSYPDGGIARMRLFGTVKKTLSSFAGEQLIDLAAAVNGGVAVACSDAHYGKAANLIAPGRARTMGEGWETARKPNRPAVLKTGANGMIEFSDLDWSVLKLCATGVVKELEIDTNHFKGNFPESCIVEGVNITSEMDYKAETELFTSEKAKALKWVTVLPRTKLSAHAQKRFEVNQSVGPLTHIRITIFPDGGVSRLRVFGSPVLPTPAL